MKRLKLSFYWLNQIETQFEQCFARFGLAEQKMHQYKPIYGCVLPKTCNDADFLTFWAKI